MIKYLKPLKVSSPKIRLGAKLDGGYVAPQIAFEKCNTLMAYGYGGDKTYEDDFVKKFNKNVYLFDHTVSDNEWTENLVSFYPEGLGPDNRDEAEKMYHMSQLIDNIETLNKQLSILKEKTDTKSLKSSINSLEYFKSQLHSLSEVISLKGVREHYNDLNLEGEVFLKIDTEGAEYDYFYNTDIKDLSTFVTGMTIEFHNLDQPIYQTKLGIILEKFKDYFILTHLHGNNWGGEITLGSYSIPRVLELSFVNKKYADGAEIDTTSYPIPDLDYPNNPDIPDCNMEFLNQI